MPYLHSNTASRLTDAVPIKVQVTTKGPMPLEYYLKNPHLIDRLSGRALRRVAFLAVERLMKLQKG